MSLIKNIFIAVIVCVLLILIINNFLLRTNIIWDNIVQGQTQSGGLEGQSRPQNTGESVIHIPGSNNIDLNDLVSYSGNTSLIVPNSAFPSSIGSNFMFTIWFFIDDFTANINYSKYIATFMGYNNLSNYPTLITFLTPFNNNLGIAIRTQTGSGSGNNELNLYFIENIPLQRWNCLIISVVDRTMDVYLDGKLVNSFILAGFYVPKPETRLFIGNNDNRFFNGFITRARYANGGVNPQQAFSIYREGINTSFAGNFLNRFRIKVGLYEYNDRVGGFSI